MEEILKNQILQFDISSAEILEEDDSEFVTASIDAFCTGMTLNNTFCDLENLKASAPTIYEKPIIFDLNPQLRDFKSHTRRPEDSLIAGFVSPGSATFREVGEKTFLNVRAKIWKTYAGKFLDVFKEHDTNRKKVSVELKLVDAEKDATGVLLMKKWIFAAICVLSDFVKEAAVGSNIMLLNFEEENQKVIGAYEEKFGKMETFEEETEEIVTQSEEEDDTSDDKGGDPTLDEPEGEKGDNPETGEGEDEDEHHPEDEPEHKEEMGCGKENMEFELDFGLVLPLFEVESDPYKLVFAESEKANTERDYKIVFDALLAKLGEKDTQIQQSAETLATLETEKVTFSEEIATLRTFKETIEKQQMDFAVDSTLKEVEKYFSRDELDEYKKTSEDFTLESIDAWRNGVKADAFARSVKEDKKPEEFVRMQMPFGDVKKHDSLWK